MTTWLVVLVPRKATQQQVVSDKTGCTLSYSYSSAAAAAFGIAKAAMYQQIRRPAENYN